MIGEEGWGSTSEPVPEPEMMLDVELPKETETLLADEALAAT